MALHSIPFTKSYMSDGYPSGRLAGRVFCFCGFAGEVLSIEMLLQCCSNVRNVIEMFHNVHVG